MIIIKNKFDIEKMKIVGKITANVLNMIKKYITPGISTGELDDICKNYIYKKKKLFQLV